MLYSCRRHCGCHSICCSMQVALCCTVVAATVDATVSVAACKLLYVVQLPPPLWMSQYLWQHTVKLFHVAQLPPATVEAIVFVATCCKVASCCICVTTCCTAASCHAFTAASCSHSWRHRVYVAAAVQLLHAVQSFLQFFSGNKWNSGWQFGKHRYFLVVTH